MWSAFSSNGSASNVGESSDEFEFSKDDVRPCFYESCIAMVFQTENA